MNGRRKSAPRAERALGRHQRQVHCLQGPPRRPDSNALRTRRGADHHMPRPPSAPDTTSASTHTEPDLSWNPLFAYNNLSPLRTEQLTTPAVEERDLQDALNRQHGYQRFHQRRRRGTTCGASIRPSRNAGNRAEVWSSRRAAVASDVVRASHALSSTTPMSFEQVRAGSACFAAEACHARSPGSRPRTTRSRTARQCSDAGYSDIGGRSGCAGSRLIIRDEATYHALRELLQTAIKLRLQLQHIRLGKKTGFAFGPRCYPLCHVNAAKGIAFHGHRHDKALVIPCCGRPRLQAGHRNTTAPVVVDGHQRLTRPDTADYG